MKFEVLSEEETLAGCRHLGIARFGDGELRLAVGGACSSQEADPNLAAELRAILATYEGFIVAVPNFERTPNRTTWDKYQGKQFAQLLQQPSYGSAFITRPDNAPWIDTPEYWDNVRALWADRDVVLVNGDDKSLTAAALKGTKAIVRINGLRQNAYREVDALEGAIMAACSYLQHPLVILCLGATATVLAARLSRRGIHALDLGHMGMFMRHAGAYAFSEGDLLSKHYRHQLRQKHMGGKWGRDGHQYAMHVTVLADTLGARSVLDYGCGAGTLKSKLAGDKLRVFEYDPGIRGKELLPKPADLVVCTDVLEHVEPESLDAVLRHIHLLAAKAAFLAISLRPARELLPDGRNAHLIVQTAEWWSDRLKAAGWESCTWWLKGNDVMLVKLLR